MDSVEKQAQDLAKSFQSKGVEINTLVQVALEKCGILVEGAAALLAPVDTGLLRKSITHRVVSGNEVQIGTNVEYAPFQEFGTVKMAPQPFLTPALNENKTNVQRIFEQEVKRAL